MSYKLKQKSKLTYSRAQLRKVGGRPWPPLGQMKENIFIFYSHNYTSISLYMLIILFKIFIIYYMNRLTVANVCLLNTHKQIYVHIVQWRAELVLEKNYGSIFDTHPHIFVVIPQFLTCIIL